MSTQRPPDSTGDQVDRSDADADVPVQQRFFYHTLDVRARAHTHTNKRMKILALHTQAEHVSSMRMRRHWDDSRVDAFTVPFHLCARSCVHRARFIKLYRQLCTCVRVSLYVELQFCVSARRRVSDGQPTTALQLCVVSVRANVRVNSRGSRVSNK